jgi:hypothetical protein
VFEGLLSVRSKRIYDQLCALFPDLAPDNDWFAYRVLRKEFRPNRPAFLGVPVDTDADGIVDEEVDFLWEELGRSTRPSDPYGALMKYGNRLSHVGIHKGWWKVSSLEMFRYFVHLCYYGPLEKLTSDNVKTLRRTLGPWFPKEAENQAIMVADGSSETGGHQHEEEVVGDDGMIPTLVDENLELPLYSPVVFACARGDIKFLEGLLTLGFKLEALAVAEAVKYGRLDMLKKLHELNLLAVGWNEDMLQNSLHGPVSVVKFIHQHVSKQYMDPVFLNKPVASGNVEVVKYMVDEAGVPLTITSETIDTLFRSKETASLEMIKFLIENHNFHFTQDHAQLAAESGAIDTLIYLQTRLGREIFIGTWIGQDSPCWVLLTDEDLFKLLESDYFHVPLPFSINPALNTLKTQEDLTKWIVSTKAMVRAASMGRLGILKVLCSKEWFPHLKYSTEVMDKAAAQGQMDVVKYLIDRYGKMERTGSGKLCTTKALDLAAANGHLDVVQFLHNRYPNQGSCTTKAMGEAAAKGHLEVVKFLHINRSEGCDDGAMEGAVLGRKLDVVKYLYEVVEKKSCRQGAIDLAIRNGDMEIVRYLYEVVGVRPSGFGCLSSLIAEGGKSGIDFVRYFNEKGDVGWNVESVGNLLVSAARGGNVETVALLREIYMEMNFLVMKGVRAARMEEGQELKTKITAEMEGVFHLAFGEAAQVGHLEIVKMLHADAHGMNKRDLLTRVTVNDHLEVVEFLVGNDIDGPIYASFAQYAFDEVDLFKSPKSGNILKLLAAQDATNLTCWMSRQLVVLSGNIELVSLFVAKGGTFVEDDSFDAYKAGDLDMYLLLTPVV